jgi:hypothetical protein
VSRMPEHWPGHDPASRLPERRRSTLLVHIKSEVGFGITRLLGFDLLPRIKRINKVRPYQPARRRTRGIPAAGASAYAPYPIGHRRRAVRPDDQIFDCDPRRHRLRGGDPAPVHPRQREPPRPTRR